MDVVISGIGGRFPRSKTAKEFNDNLLAGKSLLEPAKRWIPGALDTPKLLGHTESFATFDYTFFGVLYDLAKSSDPMMRMGIETAFEAVVDAGISPTTLRGTNAQVYTSATHLEGDCIFSAFYKGLGYVIMGRNRCMSANRISYCFGLTGRSCAYDGSSGWIGTGLALAREAILSGECDTVFINGYSMVFLPEIHKQKQNLGLLSPDSTTHPFDVDVNGCSRGEAQVTFLIQRADIAKRSYGSIVAAGSESQCNLPNWLLSVNEERFEEFVTSLYRKNGLDPNNVKILEADGLAMKDMVEPELNALDKVFNSRRRQDCPLYLGSVKTLTGDTDGCVGHIGLTKLILAMDTGVISPTIDCGRLNPNIPGLVNNRYKVVTEPTPWEVTPDTLVAMSNLTTSGIVSHVVLRANGKAKDLKTKEDYPLPYLVLLSGRNPEIVLKSLKEVTSSPFDPEYLRLTQEVFSPSIKGFEWKGYGFHGQDEAQNFVVQRENRRPVWFVYSGMGSQWPRMGEKLMAFPIVKETLQRLHKILEPKGVDLMNILTTADETIFDNILHSFVGIASIQIALTNLLNQLGIKFDGLIGHSVGELGCSYADGCLTEEQTVLAAYERGMASLKAELIPGLMAAVGLGYKQAKDMLPPDVFVACHNSKDSCTISGPEQSVNKVISSFSDKGIFVRGVNVSNIAYHSPYIRPAAPYLRDALLKVIPSPKPRSSKWICTSAPKEKWDTDEVRYCSADYQTNNLLSPVLFEEGSAHIPKNAVLIEIAPHGLLQAILSRSLTKDTVNIALTRKNAIEPAKLLLEAIGKLFLEGLSPQIWHLYPDVSMPVSRGTPSLAPLLEWDHSEVFPLLCNPEPMTKELVHKLQITSPHMEISGEKCLLASYVLVMVWKRFAEWHRLSDAAVVFEEVQFFDAIRLEEQGVISLGMMYLKATGMFDITRDEELIAQGKIRALDELKDTPYKVPAFSDDVLLNLDSHDIYVEMKNRCICVPENFRTIKSLQVRPHDWIAEVTFDEDWIALLNSLLTVFQLQSCEREQDPALLSRIESLRINPLEKEGSDSSARLHLPSRILTYRGIALHQPTFRRIENLKPKPEPFLLQFVPFGQTDIEETEQFLYLAVQLSLEKRHDTTSAFKIYDAVAKSSPLLPKICDILKTDFSIKCEIIGEETDANLVVCGSDFLKDTAKPIFTDNNCLFLTQRNEDFSNHFSKSLLKGGLEIVAESKARETANTLVVLSKVLPPLQSDDCKIVKMKPQDGLNESVKDSDHSLIILVWEDGTSKSIERVFAEALAKGYSKKLRLVFLMTPNSPRFSLSLPTYADQIRLNLSLNIYLHGKWGSYRLLPVPKKSLCSGTIDVIKTVGSKKIKISFSDSSSCGGVETKTSRLKKVVGYAVEYENGERLMGVGRCEDRSLQTILPDPHLKWPAPRFWNLEDCAFIPSSYETAYLALMDLAKLAAKDSVLITCPLTPVGQAALRIANSLGCETFALLKTLEEKRIFQKMPSVKSRHIIVSESEDPVYNIKKIFPDGVDVILNDLPGKSVTYLSAIGFKLNCRWIHIGEDAMHNADKVGMSVFLGANSMFGVTHRKLVDISVESKQRIVRWIEEGLKSGVVVPPSTTIKSLPMTNSFRTHNEMNAKTSGSHKEEIAAPRTPLESSKCLIVGGSPAQWIRLAYCLARKGYSLIALVPGKQSPNLINRHSRILRTEFATELRELESVNASETSEIGFIKDIFIFDRTSFAEDVTRLLDSKSLGDTRVTFFSEGSTQFSRKCERWYRDGFKVRAVLGVEDVPVDTVGPYLDWILSSASPAVSVLNNSAFSVVNLQVKSLSEIGVLPTSAAELQTLGASIRRSSSPIFRKLVTRNSVRRSCEVNPLFFIKGVHKTATSDLMTLGTSLLAPLYEVTLPANCSSLEDVARDVVKGVQKIQSCGPYNLAGDAIRTDVILRVAKILEDNGYASVVFVMDEEIKTTLMLLKQENRLGESILQLSLRGTTYPQEWKAVKWSWMSWAQQVETAVSKIACSDTSICEDITAALQHIHNSVLHIIETDEEVTLDHGIVHHLIAGDKVQTLKTKDRHYAHYVPSSKLKHKELADILSSNLATPVLQLKLDKARRTGFSLI